MIYIQLIGPGGPLLTERVEPNETPGGVLLRLLQSGMEVQEGDTIRVVEEE